ncbi:hypothetical protein [Maribacter sp. Hel_I_7]|uniref:hypothetical protein n=1 Tax=Maribacter sp. Hel_I_7 TaxID=1249997 RepID=UPI00047E4F5F|nr:hypothetical protein [Maribacter sp. Hel_I_7]
MILGISTKWPKKMGALAGEPTYFVEKLWKGLGDEPIDTGFQQALFCNRFDMPMYKKLEFGKPHTIREDKAHRWKVGLDIHFYIDVRKISMMRFAPVKKVTAIQELEIQWIDQDKCKLERPLVFIDGAWITDVTELALNDGFPTVEAFFTWFNTDFKGRIIHWSDVRY